MKLQFTMVATGIALALGALPGKSFGEDDVGCVGFVNVAGSVPSGGGGNKIYIELQNKADVVLGSSSYTTGSNDTDQKIADELRDNFADFDNQVFKGFEAKRLKDKNDGTEVIEFKCRNQDSELFKIYISNAEGNVTVDKKDTAYNDKNRSCNVSPSSIDLDLRKTQVTLTGTNTEWQTGVTGLSFAAGITVHSFQVQSNTQIVANISWEECNSGVENVDVLGTYTADDSTPLTGIVHDVCMPALQYTSAVPGTCIPTVSEWGLVVMAILVLSAATVVIMRRRAMVHG